MMRGSQSVAIDARPTTRSFYIPGCLPFGSKITKTFLRGLIGHWDARPGMRLTISANTQTGR
jgi:hypothetical protein